MRKFLLTFVVLVAGAMSAWAQNVAQIGSNFYTTLAEAVSAAENDATITVLSDVTLDAALVVPAGKTITLDLNGQTISMVDTRAKAGNCEMIRNEGNLTIQSSVEGGKLSYTYDGANLGTTYYANTVTSNYGSELTVKSGTIENLTFDKAVIAYAIDGHSYGRWESEGGSVAINIEGGVITSKRQAVRIFANSTVHAGTLNISGGEITGRVIVQNASTDANKAALAVTGGTFNPNAYKTDVLNVGGTNSATIAINAAVSGGTFNGAITETAVEGFISGGTFSAAAVASIQGTNLLAEGAELGEPGADGSCTVVSPGAILEINNLDDFLAFRDAVNGGNSFADMTVRLTADIDLGEDDEDWVGIGYDCDHPFDGIFDGQNHKIKNLYIYVRRGTDSNYTGLFGVISGKSVIQNLILETVEITLKGGGHSVGAVVGYANKVSGRIENVRVIVDGNDPFLEVDANHVSGVGAILGYDNDSPSLEILGCEVRGVEGEPAIVGGNEYVGGLIGYASSGIVIGGNTVADLTVTGASSVGAIAGFMEAGGEVVNNTINNVQVFGKNSDVIAGTIEGKVTIADTEVDNVKVNDTKKDNPVSTAAKVGNVYYPTLKDAATDGEDKTIEVDLFGEHTLADTVSYEHTNTVTVNGNLTYTRGLIANWNPLYLPFDADVNANKYKVAQFVSADESGIVLQLVTPEEGSIKLCANTPYVICYTNEEYKNLTIDLSGQTLEAAEEKEATWMDETTYANGFVIKGNYKKVTGAELTSNDWVVSTAGKWGRLKSESTLKPYRLILTTPEGFNASANAKSFSMRVLDGTTVVEEIELDLQHEECIFDLSGRRVETMTEGGIYIVNGKKVIF